MEDDGSEVTDEDGDSDGSDSSQTGLATVGISHEGTSCYY
jgi:hypothetical protein